MRYQLPPSADPLVAPLLALAIGMVLGWLLLFLSRRQDRKNFVYQRAPALPIRSLAEHDDAWIRGRIVCDRPLLCPWFDIDCVYYKYEIEVERQDTYTDSEGRSQTRTYWETESTDEQVVQFELVDDSGGIPILATQAEFHDTVSTDTDYEWSSRRHSARVMPISATASALGVKLEGGVFGPLREIPLLVTQRDREAFVRGGDSSERWLRWSGFLLFFATGLLAAVLYTVAIHGEPNWLLGCGGGLVLLLPVSFLSTYNRFVRSNQQAEAAWRQIDIDLEVRNSLLPQLVAVVKGYQKHEATLLEGVTALRSGVGVPERIRGEGEAARVVKNVLSLVERYPELKANTLFMDLHDRLWALEEKLAGSRSFYNRLAKEWNDLTESFPSLVVARLFGWRLREFFEI